MDHPVPKSGLTVILPMCHATWTMTWLIFLFPFFSSHLFSPSSPRVEKNAVEGRGRRQSGEKKGEKKKEERRKKK
jgi:hypothetical protein